MFDSYSVVRVCVTSSYLLDCISSAKRFGLCFCVLFSSYLKRVGWTVLCDGGESRWARVFVEAQPSTALHHTKRHCHWQHRKIQCTGHLSCPGRDEWEGDHPRGPGHSGIYGGFIPCHSRSGKLRTQKFKSHLVRTQSINVLSLKPWVGQYIAIHATLTAKEFFLAYFYASGPFTCISSQNLSRFFLCWLWLTHGSCVGPQNKIGHPARGRFPCWVPAEYK